jgi:predicted nucleotidyltransferase
MRDDLSHLPEKQQEELARAVRILMDEFEAAISLGNQPWKRGGRILKIILFGSYARNDWVDEPENGYQSDFDLLIIVSHAEATLPATRAAGAIVAAAFSATVAGFVAAWAVAELVCAISYWWLARRFIALSRDDINLHAFPARHPGLWRFVWATNLSRTMAVTANRWQSARD